MALVHNATTNWKGKGREEKVRPPHTSTGQNPKRRANSGTRSSTSEDPAFKRYINVCKFPVSVRLRDLLSHPLWFPCKGYFEMAFPPPCGRHLLRMLTQEGHSVASATVRTEVSSDGCSVCPGYGGHCLVRGLLQRKLICRSCHECLRDDTALIGSDCSRDKHTRA